MPQSVLIIGEDPDFIDFSAQGVPPKMDARKVMEGLNGSRDRLKGLGYKAHILLTRDAATIDAQVSEALRERCYDVIVIIGAGLRTLPPMVEDGRGHEVDCLGVHRWFPKIGSNLNYNKYWLKWP